MMKRIFIAVSIASVLAVMAWPVSAQAVSGKDCIAVRHRENIAAGAENPAKSRKELKEVTFAVGLHCENCVKKVKENISFEKGVKDLEVSLEKKTVKVVYDASKTSEDKLAAAIEKLGYTVEKLK